MSPSYIELVRMTLKELKQVKDFKIWNEHGQVEYLKPVDLTQVDLADVVTISKGNVEVYDEDRHKRVYPSVG